MILAIILLVLIILLLAIIIMFLFYMLFPSINQQLKITDDPVLSVNEVKYRDNEKIEKNLVTDKKAFIICSCNKKSSTNKIKFNDGYTCSMVNSVSGTGNDCRYACIGLGDCVKICPQNAIEIVNNTAVVTNLCIGCGKCIGICPLDIIKLIPSDKNESISCAYNNEENVTCSEKGNEIKTEWNDKKGFKIWNYCYNIYKRIKL